MVTIMTSQFFNDDDVKNILDSLTKNKSMYWPCDAVNYLADYLNIRLGLEANEIDDFCLGYLNMRLSALASINKEQSNFLFKIQSAIGHDLGM